jgi:hypothetical protein
MAILKEVIVMENNIKIIELELGNDNKKFIVSQDDITKDEIISLYKSYSKNDKLTISKFVEELSQYGIDLIEFEKNLISIKL